MTFAGIKKGFGARLAKARDELGYTQKEFASLTEIPLPTLKDYEGGKSIPGGEAIAKMVVIGITAEWLFQGEGEPLHPQTEARKGRRRGQGAQTVEEPRAGYVYLPLYEEVAGAAGAGARPPAQERVERELAFQEDFIRHSLGARPGDLVLARVRGDSGEPVLRDGDIALINRAERDASSDAIYFIRMGDALLYKQLQRLPGGRMKVSSRNMAYEPFTVELEKLGSPDAFDIIGRVVWACRRL